jgi:hypothetical protein
MTDLVLPSGGRAAAPPGEKRSRIRGDAPWQAHSQSAGLMTLVHEGLRPALSVMPSDRCPATRAGRLTLAGGDLQPRLPRSGSRSTRPRGGSCAASLLGACRWSGPDSQQQRTNLTEPGGRFRMVPLKVGVFAPVAQRIRAADFGPSRPMRCAAERQRGSEPGRIICSLDRRLSRW